MKTIHDLLRRDSVDQGVHDRLVRRTAAALINAAYFDVRADLPEYTAPDKIYWQATGHGHVPDVIGGPYVIEVETTGSLRSDHTKSQCELFSAFTRPRGLIFVVVVPAGYKTAMELQLLIWSVMGAVWEF